MYIPKAFEITDVGVLRQFISSHNFATVISTVDGSPFASHLPLLLTEGNHPVGGLAGHLARANPHWKAFDGQTEILAVFHGPHGYVSPTWYEASPAVPTWNYATVHIRGTAKVVEDAADLVDELVAFHESKETSPWAGELPDGYKSKMLEAIVGFRLEITSVEGKFKLGQNRSITDQLSVIGHFQDSNTELAELSKTQIRNG